MKYILLFTFGALNLIALSQPWFEKSNFGGDARHRASSFAIGNVGYIGLGHINSGVDIEYDDFWKYDPASDSWSQIANYPEGKCYHAVAFVINSIAYVGTGRLENGTYSKNFYSYNPTTNIWAPIADLIGLERRGAIGFSINGKGYVGTGQTTSGNSSDFYEYNPATDSWTAKANFIGPARTASVGFSIGNYGYIGTGQTNTGSTNDFYQYNPVTNQWTVKSPVGPTSRQEAAGFAVNGMGYIGTGDDYSSGNNYSDMWEYNPALNTWVQIEEFAGTARRYLTAFVIGSRAYAGTGTNGTNFRDFWMFDQILSVLTRKMEETNVIIYPNPASEFVKFDLKDLPNFIDTKNISIDLYSLTGQSKGSYYFETTSRLIDVSQMQTGQYVYQLNYEGRNFKTGKIIITHK